LRRRHSERREEDHAMRRVLRYRVVAAFVTAIVLGVPLNSSAGLLDLIWDTSGPQFIGPVLRCRVPVAGGATKCSLAGIPLDGPDIMTRGAAGEKRVWVSFEGGVYLSTGKNENGIDFEGLKAYMISIDPVLELASLGDANWRLYHGAGSTFQFVVGPDFRRFGKFGFKLRPIAAEFGDHWEAALNVRLYPSGFGSDQFGFGPRPSGDRPFEHSWGVMAGYKY
jgi:hypothetical protein